MPLPKPKPVELAAVVVAVPAPSHPASDFSGQRRLIRPNLALRSAPGRQPSIFSHGPALTARAMPDGTIEDSSHAEVFYFQKQIQAQTRMIVTLENGEELEGVIEWYDRYAVKLRNVGRGGLQSGARTRVLVYKDSIRYIYKACENLPHTMS
ncbi:MAG TPA: RNA chaperone Hfq [Acidobacteriaceae bacterium]|nr:RNA chaperone Hfq [Acidobacteriaceae bacterium]